MRPPIHEWARVRDSAIDAKAPVERLDRHLTPDFVRTVVCQYRPQTYFDQMQKAST